MSQQKFPSGSIVVIASTLPDNPHLVAGYEAVVECTYAQAYGGDDYQSYQLYIPTINESLFWYPEEYLSLPSDKGSHAEEHY